MGVQVSDLPANARSGDRPVFGVVTLFGLRLASMGATLGTVAVLSRVHGVGAVGVWGLVMSGVAFVGAVGDLGLGTVGQRAVAADDGHGYVKIRRAAARWLKGLTFALIALGVLLMQVVEVGGGPWSEVARIGLPVALLLSLRAVEKFYADLARARSKQVRAGLLGWQGATLATGVGAGMALLASLEPSLSDFLVWHAAWAGLGVFGLVCLERLSRSVAAGDDVTDSVSRRRRGPLREGAAISGAHVSNFLQQGADVWVLGLLVGTSESVGVYYLAARMASLVSLPLAATLHWAQPHLARSTGRVSRTDRRAITMATRLATAGALILAIGVTVASVEAYRVVASAPAPDGFRLLVLVLVAGYVVDAATGPVGHGLMLNGEAPFLITVNALLATGGVVAMFVLALTPMAGTLAVASVVGLTLAARSLLAERRFAGITGYSPLASVVLLQASQG